MVIAQSVLFAIVESVLVSRRRNDLTARFPELQSIAEPVKATTAVLDGKIVALDAKEMRCFDGLRSPPHNWQVRDCQLCIRLALPKAFLALN
jgi:hypothetical protein